MNTENTESTLIEPHFEQQEQYLIAQNQQTLNDGKLVPKSVVNVVILSYNRPRMLTEAVESVIAQNYPQLKIWIADDGSDFDVEAQMQEEFDDSRIKVVRGTKLTPEERVSTSRIGKNINSIIASIHSPEIIHYLCDDDLMGQNWLIRSALALEVNPTIHMAQGQAFTFFDGEDISKAIIGMPGDEGGLPLTHYGTGTFCHLAYCWHLEGIKWHDNEYGHSQDIDFIDAMMKSHHESLIIESPALYRREHEKSLSSLLGRKDENGRYLPGFTPPPATPDIVQGFME